jgi:hypothetical protein
MASGVAALFTRKLGPLPVWGWMGVGTAGLLAVGQGSKGKKSQAQTTAAPAVNDTSGPANAMGGYLSGGNGGNQWTGGKNGQYGHTGAPGFGNGWTRPHGHLNSSPPLHGVRQRGGHSGGWGGHQAGPGMHGIGGGSQGTGGIGHPHALLGP